MTGQAWWQRPLPPLGEDGDWGTRDPRWAGIRDEPLELGGVPVRLLCRDADPGAQDGTPHLLVHGLGGSSLSWLEVMGGLGALGPVAALDLPGFGGSPLAAGVASGPWALADVVHRVRERLGWDRVVLHGNSLGGLVAVLAERADPGAVAALVLASPALPPDLLRPLPVDLAPLAALVPLGVPGLGNLLATRNAEASTPFRGEALLDATLPAWRDLPRALLHAMAVEGTQLNRPWRRAGLIRSTRAVVATVVLDPRAVRAVKRVAAPTVVLWGEDEGLLPPTVLRGVRRRRPDWPVVLVAGAAHVPMLERPQAYVAVVGAHLAGEPVPETV